MGKSASMLVQNPIKRYHQGAGAGAAVTTAVKAVPAATIASVSACASAVHYTLLGVRNRFCNCLTSNLSVFFFLFLF